MKYTRKNKLIKRRKIKNKKGGNNFKVLYLITTSAGLPEIYKDIKDRSIVLSFKEQTPDTKIFLPNSTWTDSRNKLREYAINLPEKYDYYICIDDDITFIDYSQDEGFKKFEEQLLLKKPKIATPNLSLYRSYCYNTLMLNFSKTSCNVSNIENIIWYDAIMNAFSKDVFFDDKIFPYINKFDEKAWALSQYILIIKSYYYYNNEVKLFKDIVIKSNSNGSYPKNISNRTFNEAYDYIIQTIPDDLKEKYPINKHKL